VQAAIFCSNASSDVLADPGDGILCARPHYNGFQPDFAYRNDVHVVGVDLQRSRFGKQQLRTERVVRVAQEDGTDLLTSSSALQRLPAGLCVPQ
jgi:hypothetical protein